MERTFHPLRSLPLNVKSEEGLLLFWKANALLGLQGSVQGSFFFLSFELLDPAPLFFSFRVHGSSPSWARACGSRHGPRRSKEPGAFFRKSVGRKEGSWRSWRAGTGSTSIVHPGCTKPALCRGRTSGGQWRRNLQERKRN